MYNRKHKNMNTQTNDHLSKNFNFIGFSKEYVYKGKYIGDEMLNESDRELFGINGRRTEIVEQDILLTNKKIIKKGSEVVTEILPLFGKNKFKNK